MGEFFLETNPILTAAKLTTKPSTPAKGGWNSEGQPNLLMVFQDPLSIHVCGKCF